MATFRNVDKFNEALQDEIKILSLNVEAKNYEALKEEPKKYNFFESDDYMTFILKNRGKIGKTLESFIVFRVYAELEEVRLKSFSIYEMEWKFMKKVTAEEAWE